MKLLSLTAAALALLALSGNAQAATDFCGNPLPEAATTSDSVIDWIYPDGYRLVPQDAKDDVRLLVADLDTASTIIVVRPTLMCV